MFHVHRAERADDLVASLGDVVSSPLSDPFQAEVVAVPTRGVERWLTQRLSAVLGASPHGADGVCANVEFPFPGRVVNGALAAASGVDRENDPWLPERSVWPLLEVVESSILEPWLAPLTTHLGGAGSDTDPSRGARRLTSVRHLADLFDRYSVHRPAMLRAWANGRDDGWQAELWRELRERIDIPSPAERLDVACARLRDDPDLVDLPVRVSLFGLTRLPASYLDVLRALAAERDVHLFLLHPSAELWARLASVIRDHSPIVRRAEDTTAALPKNPLLASWGRDAREMQLVLAVRTDDVVVHNHLVVEEARSTLLARIQADIRADRTPPGPPLPGARDERMLLQPNDRSLQVHACHGRARQVEVMRDAILHLLDDDPTLEPRDVIVLCPDIETFAPLIQATFGTGPSGHERDDAATARAGRIDLHVRLADRSLRQTNPVLGVVAQLLDLAGGRLTASQVLDLAGRAPVRRRFRLDDDELTRIAQWARDGGVRWGLDAAHRAPYRLDRLTANTWQAGWDRVLVGAAMADEEQRLFGGVLPLDDVGSGDIDLAGRFAEFLQRLRAIVNSLDAAMPLDAWAEALAEAADSLTAAPGRDAWQRVQLGRLLEEVVGEGTTSGAVTQTALVLPEIRSLLADRLRGRPTRASFRSGHLTICTLVPMRSVPHRVVCLMGLDDGVFPRHTARDGDDLLVLDPHVGDRDARSEDHQLLLDALLAATDHLAITYEARDERTNLHKPPAVPLGELLDVVDRTARVAEEAPTRERVIVEHPLQPFDPRNFDAGSLLPERTWSFDRTALDGARALTGRRTEAPPFLAGPLPPEEIAVIELEQLVRFVQHPVRAFLRRRLGIAGSTRDDDLEDALSIELDALEQWGVGERLLEALLAGANREAAITAEIARGGLPPDLLAEPVLARVYPVVEQLVVAAADYVPAAHRTASLDVNVQLQGRTLVGTVPGVRGDLVAALTYSRIAPRHRLTAWVHLLALAAARPATAYEAVTLGRRRADRA
jgi:exodeoxyribonuclease V gamma subunit